MYKFCKIQFCDPDFQDLRICTTGVEFYHAKWSYVHLGVGLLGTAVISNKVYMYFISIR